MSGTGASAETRPSLLLRVRDAADAEAWRTFMTIYAPLVYGYVRRRGLQDADAADLTQDVMSEVARAIRSFEYQPARGRFRDWLLLITRRRLARFISSQARRHEHVCASVELEQLQDERSQGDWDDAFNARLLRVALERIRPCFEPITWRAFELAWIENRPAAETARELSVRIELVYIAKSRVLKRLWAEVEELIGGLSWLDAPEDSGTDHVDPSVRYAS